MVRINIEIEEIENGFTVEDSYSGEITFCKTFEGAVKEANKSFRYFKKQET